MPHALTLPTIPSAVPSGFTVDGEKNVMHVIAEGLLEEGLLEESDWDAALGLAGSVMRGLQRWSLTLLPQQFDNSSPFASLPSFEIGVGDNCRQWGVSVPNDIGGFALLLDDEEEITATVVVGTQVRALEAWCPGAGFSLLSELYRSFGWTLGAATPPWAMGFVGEWWDGSTEEDKEEEGEIAPARFRAKFPRKALYPRWRVRTMREALWRAKGLTADDWRGEAVRVGWQLRRTLDRWNRAWKAGRCRMSDATCYEEAYLPPVMVEWDSGWVNRVYDDVAEAAYGTGLSACGWLAQFPSGDVEGVRIAARSLRYALTVVSLGDRLLSLLDMPVAGSVAVPVEVQERGRVRV